MTRIQRRLSTVLMAAMLGSVPWVYGGGKKQGTAQGSSMPPVSVHRRPGQVVVNQTAALAALDAGTHLPWAGEDRQQAHSLLARLQERGIVIQPTFYKMLGVVVPAQRGKLINRCRVFFDSVDTQEITNTGCLTGMIRTNKQICSFLSRSDDLVRRVARTPALRSLTSLFNRRGFPEAEEDTQAFLQRDIWWWQGEDSACTLDRELLRIFCSMLIGKGLPDQETVDNYLNWDVWWQRKGNVRTLDRGLLRIFSSIFNGKGLPDKKSVDDYLQLDIWWRGEGTARTLDRELLRTFSSMFHGRGLPDHKAVADYLQWQVWWLGEGELRIRDLGLLRTFSSMFSSRGLPEKKAVEDYLQLDVWWRGEGDARTLDRELLRTFSSMFSGRGLPDKKVVKDYLQRNIWWQGDGEERTLDRKLLRVVSSMFRGKGLPDQRVMDNYLKWDIWSHREGDARTLDRELLQIFSSMFCGRGLPDKKAVEDYLQLDIWWQGVGEARTLDRELLRVFSPMFNGRGLPDKKAVDSYLQWEIWWQGDGEARTLDRELLRTFSSMFGGRGLPEKKAVDCYLRWGIWWQGDGEARTLDRELLRTFSSMFCGKGLPDKKTVDDYLQWDVWWQGTGEVRILDRKLLRAFSSMFSGKGLPDKLLTNEILQWLTWEQRWNRQVTRTIVHLYSGVYSGYRSLVLPDINRLMQEEQKLKALIFPGGRGPNEKSNTLAQIKMVALYLANDGGTRQLNWSDCEAWLREYSGFLSNMFLLGRLLLALHYHGGQGIKEAVALITGRPATAKWFVLDAISRGHALTAVQHALQTIDSSEWQRYLFFTKELHPLPADQEWQTIKRYLDALAPVLRHRQYLRWFLSLIWPLSPADRERFVQPEAVAKLSTLLPSVQVLRNLSKCLNTDELKMLFDTCLAYWSTESQEGCSWEPADPSNDVPGAAGVEQRAEQCLSVALLSKLLKNRIPMNPVLWAAADHHKDKLSPSLLALLKGRANRGRDGRVPDSLKAFLSGCDQQCQNGAAHAQPASVCFPVTPSTWLQTVLGQSVLVEADIDQLYAYRDQLSSDQVVDILFRMDQSVSQKTVQRWQFLLGEKYQQALESNPPLLIGSDGAIEALRDCEDILSDLFPDALL